MSISVRDLTVSYPGGPPVVTGLDIKVAANEWLAVIGPNGAGKSTLLRAIAGLIRGSGSISLNGSPLTDLTRKETSRQVAFVPQEPVMPDGMTVAGYILLGRTPHLRYLRSEGPSDLAAAAAAAAALDLTGFEDRPLDGLSGGERQRVVLARALAQEPSILLLDEPTSALDIGHQQQALDQIGDIRSTRPMTIVSAMHDLTLAGQFADRLALIARGRIVAHGPPEIVLTESAISDHYGASVEIVQLASGGVAVVPVRRSRDRTNL
jgi:iron complex transport system ATP-binding protein